jgi:hypothetical protein
MIVKWIIGIFLAIFSLTAVVALIGVSNVGWINPQYEDKLFNLLLVELIGIVIGSGATAFKSILDSAKRQKDIEYYRWKIAYPANLRSIFEDLYLANDPSLKEFHQKNNGLTLSEIRDKELSRLREKEAALAAVSDPDQRNVLLHEISAQRNILENYLDVIFVIRKSQDFSGRHAANGHLFLIRENSEGQNDGKAVLEFPDETQPIAFDLTGEQQVDGVWKVSFVQPERYVYYQGRLNRWVASEFEVQFSRLNDQWSGPVKFGPVGKEVIVGVITLARKE